MTIEIWIKEGDIENLKVLMSRQWFSDINEYEEVGYKQSSHVGYICVHIGLNEYTILKNHDLLYKKTN